MSAAEAARAWLAEYDCVLPNASGPGHVRALLAELDAAEADAREMARLLETCLVRPRPEGLRRRDCEAVLAAHRARVGGEG